jgi:hypothetical protein
MPGCRLTQFAKPTHIPTTLDHLQVRHSQPKNFHCICPFGKISFFSCRRKATRDLRANQSHVCAGETDRFRNLQVCAHHPICAELAPRNLATTNTLGQFPSETKFSEQTIHYAAMAKGSSKHSLTVTSPNSPRPFLRHSKFLLFYPTNELLLIAGYGQPYGSDD